MGNHNTGSQTCTPEANLSRRGFLKLSALGIGASTALMGLAGCSPTKQNLSNTQAEDEPRGEADETIQTGFLIIGSGIAGYSAAIEALEGGMTDVILIEKNSTVGGNTLFAEGIFATHSAEQEARGIGNVDGNAVLLTESDAHHQINNHNLMKSFIDASSENVNWLMDHGISFITVEVESCGGKCLHIYDGGNGTSAINILAEIGERDYGLDVRTDTRAIELILEDDAVVGARVETADGGIADIYASTTLLATGGLSSSDEAMDEYTKMSPGKYRYVGNKGQDGDGQRMAEATAMGKAKNICAMNMWLNVQGAEIKSVPNFIGGSEGSNVWVNEMAARFVNEEIAGSPSTLIDCNNAVHSQGRAYSIFDTEHVQFFKEHGTTSDWSGFSPTGEPQPEVEAELDAAVNDESVAIYRADTLEELAALINVDATQLSTTIQHWNASVVAGRDDEFGKSADLMFAVKQAPFYACALTNGILTTVGGVRVNELGQVTSPDGTPVENLYAAGVCCSGFTGENYSMAAPGTAQGSGVFLGRAAARAAIEKQ